MAAQSGPYIVTGAPSIASSGTIFFPDTWVNQPFKGVTASLRKDWCVIQDSNLSMYSESYVTIYQAERDSPAIYTLLCRGSYLWFKNQKILLWTLSWRDEVAPTNSSLSITIVRFMQCHYTDIPVRGTRTFYWLALLVLKKHWKLFFLDLI